MAVAWAPDCEAWNPFPVMRIITVWGSLILPCHVPWAKKTTTHTLDGIQVIHPQQKLGFHQPQPPHPYPKNLRVRPKGFNSTWVKKLFMMNLKYPSLPSPNDNGDGHNFQNAKFLSPLDDIATVNINGSKKISSCLTWFNTSFQWCRIGMPSASLGNMYPSRHTPFSELFFQHKETVLAVFANGPTKFWASTTSLELMLSISSNISLSSQRRLFHFFTLLSKCFWEGSISKVHDIQNDVIKLWQTSFGGAEVAVICKRWTNRSRQ